MYYLFRDATLYFFASQGECAEWSDAGKDSLVKKRVAVGPRFRCSPLAQKDQTSCSFKVQSALLCF